MSPKFNSIFLRMLAAFLAAVLMLTAALAISFEIFSERAEKLAIEKAQGSLENSTQAASRCLMQLKYTLDELGARLLESESYDRGRYFESEDIRKLMRTVALDRRQNEFSKYVVTMFIKDTQRDGQIYELTGVYTADTFFNQYYANEVYTNDFWRSAIVDGDAFNVYASEMFSGAREARKVELNLLPVAYKPSGETRFIAVALLDMDKLAADFGLSGMYDSGGACLYRQGAAIPEQFPAEANAEKADGGYILSCDDAESGEVKLVRFVNGEEIAAETKNTRKISLAVFAVAIVLALILLVPIAYACSVPLWQIMSELCKENNAGGKMSLRRVRDGVNLWLSQKTDYLEGVNEKQSVLNSIFLQSKMRDVYVGIEEIGEHVSISQSFFMLYTRVHFKEEFEKYIGGDAGKATFFLKQLLELYLEKADVEATTFQIENDVIVSVFNVKPDFDGTTGLVKNILLKLENESEYAFFTVVVSKIYDDIGKIKAVYDNLLDLSKYGRPISETQVLFEGEVKRGAGRFFFSVEEMGKLTAVLQNGAREDAIRKFREILDFNIKKDVTGFDLYLLCTEVVSCSVKLANRLFNATPATLNVAEVYRRLDRAYMPQRYQEVCEEFLGDVSEYIRQNKREDDYIISYILDYVDNHYAEDIYLNLFAEKLKLTGAYISSYFKEKMNVNLSDYVNNYRIKRALELSENPQNKNKDIAAMVGLPNINTFIRLFKKYTGHTPAEYRKKHFGE